MVSQTDEEQRSLFDHRVTNDRSVNNETVSYSTFPSGGDAQPKAQNDADATEGGEPDGPGYSWMTIIMVMSTWVGVFLASMDMAIMATLTGPISESFGSFHLLSWFINAYTVSSAMIQPLSGKLSDIYGRRNCLLVSNFLFLLGNLLCGLATRPWHFILGRAIAGLGGGCLHSISTFLASDVIPLRSRGFWQGISNVAFAVGFGLGGALGGVVDSAVGWRWAFLFQPPTILVSMVVVYCVVPKYTTTHHQESRSIKRIDFLGSATLTAAILALMWGAVSGGNTLPWSSPAVYVPLALFPLLLAAFAYIEDKIAKDPVIPIRLLANRTVLGSCLTCLLSTTANTSLTYYLPIAMETKGLSPAEAGLRLFPYAIGAFVGSLGAGALMNLTGKYYWLCLVGHTLMVTASLTVLLMREHVTSWFFTLLFFMNGLGMGTMLVITLLALIAAAEHKQHAVLTSASYAFRSAGNTLGITIAGAIFQNVFNEQLWARLGNERNASTLIPQIRRRDIGLGSLPVGWKIKVLDSYDVSFEAVFVFAFATHILAFISASIIREHTLHKTLERK